MAKNFTVNPHLGKLFLHSHVNFVLKSSKSDPESSCIISLPSYLNVALKTEAVSDNHCHYGLFVNVIVPVSKSCSWK